MLGGEDNVPMSNIMQDSAASTASVYKSTKAIKPPIDPAQLAFMFEISGPLRTNIDAYAANIDAHGHTFSPVVDLQDESSFEVIRQAMFEKTVYEQFLGSDDEDIHKRVQDHMYKSAADLDGDGALDSDELLAIALEEITDEMVEERISALRHEMTIERSILEFFFDNCSVEESFVELRRNTRQDYEIFGNAYWEVLRSADGEPAQVNLLPAAEVRLLPMLEPVEVETRTVKGIFLEDSMNLRRRFRQFIQVPGSSSHFGDGPGCVYFKSYGDPRVFSAKTGEEYESVEDIPDGEVPATELIHFRIYNSRTPYGIPRWISELINIAGARYADEVNYMFFENKSIPPMAILVSGGSLSEESRSRVESHIRNEIKGAKNFHKILILEAESADNFNEEAGHVRVEFKQLGQKSDASFLAYSDHIRDGLGMVFRNPRLVRGDMRDFNRACYDDKTQTLTDRGWIYAHEYQEGDRVAAFNPTTEFIEFVEPKSLQFYEVEDEELIHFTGQDLDIKVTENHTMLVREPGSHGPFSVLKSENVPWRPQEFRTRSEGCFAPEIVSYGVPGVPGAVNGDDLLIYTAMWLLDSPECEVHKLHGRPNLTRWLEAESRSRTRIPDFARILNERQADLFLEVLVNGLTLQEEPDPRLLDDVQAIMAAQGLGAAITEEGLEISQTSSGVSSSVERVKYTGDVHCFSIPGYGFYVTRRNGKIAIQGNTAQTSMLLAERQVYGPERKSFDWKINKEILPALGIRFWKFRSLPPDISDPNQLNMMIESASRSGHLSVSEMRKLSERIWDFNFPVVDSWTARAPQFLLRSHQSSLKQGGLAGFEQELNAPEREQMQQPFSDTPGVAVEPEDVPSPGAARDGDGDGILFE
jgi:PBSX family phage portal protein